MKLASPGAILLLLFAATVAADRPATEPSEPISVPVGPPVQDPHPRQILFVCAVSGANDSSLPTVKSELEKAVEGLRPIQSFDLIFIEKDGCVAFSKRLVNAVPEKKRDALNFLKGLTISGGSDPIPALELAFSEKPQLMYLLTDHDFPNDDLVLKKIKELNRSHAVKINTIAFLPDGSRPEALLELLKNISIQSGGVYKSVAQDSLDSPVTQPTSRP